MKFIWWIKRIYILAASETGNGGAFRSDQNAGRGSGAEAQIEFEA